MKKCTKCGEVKPLGDYYLQNGRHMAQCKECKKAAARARFEEKREEVIEKNREYRGRNKEELARKARERRAANPEKYREADRERWERRAYYSKRYYLRYNYGITSEEYDAMLEAQGGVCAICKRPETGKHQSGNTKSLAVDHCHTTGKIRGLLCGDCNRAIGLFEDDVSRLGAAIAYLSR